MRDSIGLTLSLAALVSISACSMLPRSGPNHSEMMAAGSEHHDIAIVDLDSVSVGLLQSSPPPSLAGTFGDFRPPGEQRIGIGDAVQITLWESGAGGLFSSPVVDRTSAGSRSVVIPDQVVTRDGSITVPFAGRIQVTGRTPPQVERIIMERLADKAIDPQALVTVSRNSSNTATVMGEVGPGAQVPLNVRGNRLLEVIAAAGGVRAPVSDTAVALSRDGRTVRVPMEAVLDDPRENIYLRPDDVVTLVRDPQAFTTMGATQRVAMVPFEARGVTLDEALAKVGGLDDYRANPAAVFVLRFETEKVARQLPQAAGIPGQPGGVPVIYHVDLRDPASIFLARRFPIHNKDIVYVSDAPTTELQKVLNLFNLLVTPAVTGATVSNSVR